MHFIMDLIDQNRDLIYSIKFSWQQIEDGKKCRLDIASTNPNLHLGDWKCEVWNGFQKLGGGQPEEEATIRVIELGVQYSSHLSNKEERSLELESKFFRLIKLKITTINYIFVTFTDIPSSISQFS